MAQSPNDFRDPQVTDKKSSGGIGKWIAIALAALLAALLLSWLLNDDDVETTAVPTESGTVVVTE